MSIANTLSLNQSYLVIFDKTKQPFITPEGDAVIYIKESDAAKFLNDNPGTTLYGPEFFKAENICSACYGSGAIRLKVIMPNRTQERYEDLKKMPKKKYYNNELNYSLNLLHETKKKEYLYKLGKGFYIVPIKINNDSSIVIEYSIAKIKDKNYFMAFTSLDEYNAWAERVAGYEPLEISFNELTDLCKEDDCLLNVSGARYVLNQDKIAMIKSKYTKTEYNID